MIGFKTLPEIHPITYQGSESSTSEGIIKIFEDAKKLLLKRQNRIPLVVFEEMGLAELSKSNPLKVTT